MNLFYVGGDGFEPPKASPADLQSAPFGHSGNHPFSKSIAKVWFYFVNKEYPYSIFAFINISGACFTCVAMVWDVCRNSVICLYENKIPYKSKSDIVGNVRLLPL